MSPLPRGSRRTLQLTTALVALCGLAGCSALTASTTSTSVTPQTSATPGPTSTFVQTAPPSTTSAPTLANTGTNMSVVVASLIKYGQWLLTNPDPSKVTNMAEPGCAAANQLIAQTRSLIDQDAYVTTTTPTVTNWQYASPAPSSSATSVVSPTTVTLRMSKVAEPVTPRSATSSTTVTSYLPALPSTTVQIVLNKGTDGKWRICQVSTPFDDTYGDTIAALI
ncbi:hypothetical protein [Actinoplanes sp. NPDC051851]|uniref:hypothetical protein n=1 Tax=Actinoplanes sp. NPDC051851 TaxID=3154753 RepID=UPI0034319387